MTKRLTLVLLLLLALLAPLAHAGTYRPPGGGGSGTTISGLTPSTCLRADDSGTVVSASGDCRAGDSAGTVANFSGIGAGTNTNALIIGTGGSLAPGGSGSITANYATGSGKLDDQDDGGSDPALSEVAILHSIFYGGSQPWVAAGGKLTLDSTVPWPGGVNFSQLTGTEPIWSQAAVANILFTDPAGCPANEWGIDTNQAAGLICSAINFSQLAGGLSGAQLPDFGTPGTFTNMGCNVDAKGRVSGCANGSSTGEANTCTSLGAQLNLCTGKTGVTLNFVTLNASDFDIVANVVSLESDVVRSPRAINTGAGLTGGGNLTIDRTISIPNDGIGPTQVDETATYAFLNLSGKQKRNQTSVNDDDCTGEQGNWWFDTTDQSFEFCDDNSGPPKDFKSGFVTGTIGSTANKVVTSTGSSNGVQATGATLNPAGDTFTLADPGDGSRQWTNTNNTSTIAAPTSGKTSIGPIANRYYKRSSVDGAPVALSEDWLVVLADPNESGSHSCGLQEALTRCNGGAGGCTIRLSGPCTAPARSTWGDQNFFETNGADHVVLDGNGRNAPITWTDNAGTNTTTFIAIEPGSVDVEVKDFAFTGHETCTSTCNKTGAGILVSSTAQDVRIHDNDLTMTEAVTSDTSYGCYRLIWVNGDTSPTPDSVPEQVKITHNTISHSCRGVEIQFGDYVSVIDNDFNMEGRPDDQSTPASFDILKYEGVGDIISQNRFDMALDGYATLPFHTAIGLSNDFGDTAAAATNKSVSITSNQIFGMRGSATVGIDISGYDSATIDGNHFFAGQCSASATRSCYTDEKCADLGGTCNSSASIGIVLTGDATAGNSRNRLNNGVANTFDGFQDNDTTVCPIFITGVTGSDPLENSDNAFSSNIFGLNDATKDGICGDLTIAERNHFSNNTVRGSTNMPLNTDVIHQTCGTVVTQNQDFFAMKLPAGVNGRILRFWCASQAITTAPTYNLDECNSSGASCGHMTAAAITCASGAGQTACASGCTTTLTGASSSDAAADEILQLDSTNVGVATTQWCIDWRERP